MGYWISEKVGNTYWKVVKCGKYPLTKMDVGIRAKYVAVWNHNPKVQHS
jgi:hypothetical protein